MTRDPAAEDDAFDRDLAGALAQRPVAAAGLSRAVLTRLATPPARPGPAGWLAEVLVQPLPLAGLSGAALVLAGAAGYALAGGADIMATVALRALAGGF